MPPSKMKAIKAVSVGKAEVQEVPVPKVRDDRVLVQVKAVALNPTDWKHIAYEGMNKPGHTSGCDFSGVIEEVGAKIKAPWKRGDRIAGFIHGMKYNDAESGSFAEYALAKGDLWPKVPDNMSDEEAATIGVGVSTVGQALYQALNLPLPGEGKAGFPLLVYGGSTATGTLAIQFGRLSGCEVITTCSPRNFDLVKSLGAAQAFDYNDPDCAKKIREYTSDKLTRVIDCISEGDSPRISAEAISSKGGEIVYIGRSRHEREDVKGSGIVAYTILGDECKIGERVFPANQEDFEFGKKFLALAAKLLEEGKVKVHPVEVRPNGLQGVLDGLQQMKNGQVSGVKLVYRVDETP